LCFKTIKKIPSYKNLKTLLTLKDQWIQKVKFDTQSNWFRFLQKLRNAKLSTAKSTWTLLLFEFYFFRKTLVFIWVLVRTFMWTFTFAFPNQHQDSTKQKRFINCDDCSIWIISTFFGIDLYQEYRFCIFSNMVLQYIGLFSK